MSALCESGRSELTRWAPHAKGYLQATGLVRCQLIVYTTRVESIPHDSVYLASRSTAAVSDSRRSTWLRRYLHNLRRPVTKPRETSHRAWLLEDVTHYERLLADYCNEVFNRSNKYSTCVDLSCAHASSSLNLSNQLPLGTPVYLHC